MRETMTERCERCSADTDHEVRVEIQEENDEGSPHSREPYRVTECAQCGLVNEERMNRGGRTSGGGRWSA